MTKIKNYLLALTAIAITLTMACGGGGGDPEPTPEELRIIALAGDAGVTWRAITITQDGSPANGFDNFSLTMRGTADSKTYSSTDADPLIAASGPWDFVNGNLAQITFNGDNDNVFVISNLNTDATPATLTLSVNFTNPNGGVVAGASGTYVFNLQAQ